MTKLLIVDDEPLTVDMLQTFLQINGYETIGAFNGEDGLVMVQAEQPEMMILDLMLPDIEGFEVCRRIRTLPDYARYAGIPVLVLSARIEEAAKKRAMEVGANAYLTKPVKFPDLLAELRRLTIKEQAAPPASPTNESPPEAPMSVPSSVPDRPVVATPPPTQPAINKSESTPGTPMAASSPEPPAQPASHESGTPPVSPPKQG